LFESFIGNFSPKRLKNESFIESFISVFLLVQDIARDRARKATENKNFIKNGIRKYVEYWASGMAKCAGYAESIRPYLQYWEDVLEELNKPLPKIPSELQEGFWPRHDWRNPPVGGVDPLGLLPPLTDVTPEDEDPVTYCGAANAIPKTSFNPWRDVKHGSWVLVRPSDPNIWPVWHGRVVSEVIREEGHPHNNQFLVKYWEPDNAHGNLKAKYQNCWDSTCVPDKEKPVFYHVNAVLFAVWSSILNQKSRRIPQNMKAPAMLNLEGENAADP
jgi:hypothetical protein